MSARRMPSATLADEGLGLPELRAARQLVARITRPYHSMDYAFVWSHRSDSGEVVAKLTGGCVAGNGRPASSPAGHVPGVLAFDLADDARVFMAIGGDEYAGAKCWARLSLPVVEVCHE